MECTTSGCWRVSIQPLVSTTMAAMVVSVAGAKNRMVSAQSLEAAWRSVTAVESSSKQRVLSPISSACGQGQAIWIRWVTVSRQRSEAMPATRVTSTVVLSVNTSDCRAAVDVSPGRIQRIVSQGSPVPTGLCPSNDMVLRSVNCSVSWHALTLSAVSNKASG